MRKRITSFVRQIESFKFYKRLDNMHIFQKYIFSSVTIGLSWDIPYTGRDLNTALQKNMIHFKDEHPGFKGKYESSIFK